MDPMTMKVRLKVSRVGNNFTQRPGDVIDVPWEEGLTLVARGDAERVAGGKNAPAEPETAVIAPAERAVKPPGRVRKRGRSAKPAKVPQA